MSEDDAIAQSPSPLHCRIGQKQNMPAHICSSRCPRSFPSPSPDKNMSRNTSESSQKQSPKGGSFSSRGFVDPDLLPPQVPGSKRESYMSMLSHDSVQAAEIGEAVPVQMQDQQPKFVAGADDEEPEGQRELETEIETETEVEARGPTPAAASVADLSVNMYTHPKEDSGTDGFDKGIFNKEPSESKMLETEYYTPAASSGVDPLEADPSKAEGMHENTSEPTSSSRDTTLSQNADLVTPNSPPLAPQAQAPQSTPGYAVSEEHDTDLESMFSEGQVPLGRLNTINAGAPAAPPSLSVNTGVDGTIPPRLRRRPVSEMISRPVRPLAGHRLSLNISEDLDRLMASATDLQEQEEQERERERQEIENRGGDKGQKEGVEAVEDREHLERGHEKEKQARSGATSKRNSRYSTTRTNRDTGSPVDVRALCLSSTFSSDSFLTAEGGVLGSPRAPVALPKRPSPDNMQRARQASQKWGAGLDIEEVEGSEATVARAEAPEFAQNTAGEMLADQGEYYDVEEPVVITGPTRVRSVKDSIRHQRHKSKARSRRSGPKLRPFSYNTLINLLESINGTVVGEEFELLNLPAKEKQLIEKIVDLLSRLTLDMVTDESRYDVGIERLEKAHRALEGFL